MEWYARSLAEHTPWSYILLAGQVMLLAMLIERAVFLLFKAQVNAQVFLQHIRKLVLEGERDRALKLCAAIGTVPISRVCQAGLAGLGQGPFALKEQLDRAVAEQLPVIQRRLGRIAVLSIALVIVGVVASKLSGASELTFGGDGPLPLGLAMEYAPALVGGVAGAVGLLGWLLLSSGARRVQAGLEQCKQLFLDLSAQVK